jgi:hypothetical protein
LCIAHVVLQIQAWLTSEEPTLMLGKMTSFQRLLVYQVGGAWPAE